MLIFSQIFQLIFLFAALVDIDHLLLFHAYQTHSFFLKL